MSHVPHRFRRCPASCSRACSFGGVGRRASRPSSWQVAAQVPRPARVGGEPPCGADGPPVAHRFSHDPMPKGFRVSPRRWVVETQAGPEPPPRQKLRSQAYSGAKMYRSREQNPEILRFVQRLSCLSSGAGICLSISNVSGFCVQTYEEFVGEGDADDFGRFSLVAESFPEGDEVRFKAACDARVVGEPSQEAGGAEGLGRPGLGPAGFRRWQAFGAKAIRREAWLLKVWPWRVRTPATAVEGKNSSLRFLPAQAEGHMLRSAGGDG